ncbi:hypothetical protein EHQ53_08790 [Leptospira langatensis]|uniref:Glycosyltransferase RgtA/B/C/D-like domain-containing protein n=1 Tax=Leptospira langatensis TaxID=2484983 RepID=A0A5F1ZVH8_9LEPT|nr:hypothetical protein [Leptospira langatensis]TGK01275.1 hypothetical protein EHO57_10080 [Leptospira langatensis]TGL42272.1 hypothetical protein EHQ53_08790 [Leptospira langatensis]
MSSAPGSSVPKTKQFLFYLLLALPLLYPILLKPSEQLYSDHLGKFVLGESVLRNHFRSGDLALPSRELDKQSRFCPTECIRIDEEVISPFPATLGYFYALILPWGGIEGVYIVTSLFVLASLLLLSLLWEKSLAFLSILAICTPFVVNGYFFPDVGIGAFLFVLGSFLFLRADGNTAAFSFLVSGFLSAFAGWFRIEALVFPASFLFFLFWFRFRAREERKGILLYLLGFLVGAFLLLGTQYLLYHHPMGPRFSFNQPTMFISPLRKGEIYLGLLIANPNRIGFFGYTPLFVIVLLFSVYFLFFQTNFFRRKEEEPLSKRNIFVISGLAAFVLLVLSAPNDGIIDFGSRYLHLSLPSFVGMLLTLSDSISKKFPSKTSGKIGKAFGILLLLFSAYMTFSYTQILGRFGRKSTKMNQVYLDQKPDLVVVQVRTHAQILGKYFFQTPSVWLVKEAWVQLFFSENDPNQFSKILFVQSKASFPPNPKPEDLFEKNSYYKAAKENLGPGFERDFVENREDVLIFSMKRKN